MKDEIENSKIKLVSRYNFIDIEDCGVFEDTCTEEDNAIFFEGTAYQIIKSLLDGKDISEVANLLINDYEVEYQVLLDDIIELSNQLVEKGIVEVV